MEHLFDSIPESLLVRIPSPTLPNASNRSQAFPPTVSQHPPPFRPTHAYPPKDMYDTDPRAAPYPRQLPYERHPGYPAARPSQPAQQRPVLPGFGIRKPSGNPAIQVPSYPSNPPRLPSNYYNNLSVNSDVNRRRKYERRVAKQDVRKSLGPSPAGDPSLAPINLVVPTVQQRPASHKPAPASTSSSSVASSVADDDNPTASGSMRSVTLTPSASPKPVTTPTRADEKRKALSQLIIPDEEKAKASKVTLSEALAFLSATVSREDILAMLDGNSRSAESKSAETSPEDHEDETGLRRSKRVKRAPKIIDNSDSEDEEESNSALTLSSAIPTAAPVTPQDGLRARLLRKKGSIDLSERVREEVA